jgi:hypothetical protein
MVIHEQGNGVAPLDPQRPKQVSALVGTRVEVGIGHRLAGSSHDVSGLTRVLLGMSCRMHRTSANKPTQGPLVSESPRSP